MLSASQLIHLPYTPDLTDGGIAFALRTLLYSYNRASGSPYERLRRIVSAIAVELSFRHYLTEQNISFEIKGAAPFSDPDRYDVSLGGHRCDIKSFLITYREQITQIHNDPAILLKAPALVPLDQYSAEGHSNEDIYLFAFITGLFASSQEDIKKIITSHQAHYLIHVLPDEWRKPKNWKPLNPIIFKSESEQPILLEVHGQNENREFITHILKLMPSTRIQLEEYFFAITSLHAKTFPSARLGMHSPHQKETYIIHSNNWHNIHLHGMDIYLTGYLKREEFRRHAQLIQPGARVFQYDQTRTKNLAVPISNLHSIQRLLENVKNWENKS